MKKFKASGLILTLLIMFSGCDELPDPAGLRGVAVVPAITDVDPGIFDSKDLENSFVEFVITVPEGSRPEKITVTGSYEDNHESIILTEANSFPATVRLYSSDVIQKLGIASENIENGDVFMIELLTTVNEITTRSNALLFVPVACAYNPTLAVGSYHAVSSDWGSEGNITLTADPDDPYMIYVSGLEEIEGLVEDLGPLVMHINPATYNVSVPEKAISSDAWGYGAISYSGNGVYSSCDGLYTMYFDISLTSLGGLGTYLFTLTRNP
ncbi:MAG: hypothetical protein RBR81_03435 [Bacteroidales bacterium]|jgi:hypothetical protein|nr:hypothetical protein [Bacteroidales bacterium]